MSFFGLTPSIQCNATVHWHHSLAHTITCTNTNTNTNTAEVVLWSQVQWSYPSPAFWLLLHFSCTVLNICSTVDAHCIALHCTWLHCYTQTRVTGQTDWGTPLFAFFSPHHTMSVKNTNIQIQKQIQIQTETHPSLLSSPLFRLRLSFPLKPFWSDEDLASLGLFICWTDFTKWAWLFAPLLMCQFGMQVGCMCEIPDQPSYAGETELSNV